MTNKCFVFTCMMLAASTCGAQSYTSLWKDYETAVGKDMPKDALTIANKIEAKAKAEGNSQHRIAASVLAEGIKAEISGDSLPGCISRLTLMADEYTGTDRLVALAILGSAYASDAARFQNRKDDESQESYETKAKECFTRCIADMSALAKTDAGIYAQMLTSKVNALSDDMLGVMVSYVTSQYCLDDEERYDMYKRAIATYDSLQMHDASVVMNLRLLECARDIDNVKLHISSDEFSSRLLNLWNKNKERNSGADVLYAIVQQQDSNTKKLRYVNEGLSLYKNSPLANTFKNIQKELTASSVDLKWNDNILAGRDFTCTVTAHNLSDCELTVRNTANDAQLLRKTIHFNSKAYSDTIVTDTNRFDMRLDPGKYVYELKSKGLKSKTEVRVTSMRLFSLGLPNGNRKIVVLNNVSGTPVRDAKIVCAKNYNNLQSKKSLTLYTDENGEAILTDNDMRVVKAVLPGGDETGTVYTSRHYESYKSVSYRTPHTHIYTDRAIYRPGQTISASVLSYWQNGDSAFVMPDKTGSVILYDANGKVADSCSVKTNAYGTAYAKLKIPEGRLNGSYSIMFDNVRQSVKVEEYKRPTFYVERSDDSEADGKLSLGDSVRVQFAARYYSSSPVPGAKVTYTVESCKNTFWRFYYGGWSRITREETVTDANGLSGISFKLDDGSVLSDDDVLRFKVTAEVTNLSGETQTSEAYFSVSASEYALKVQAPSLVTLDDTAHVTAAAANYEGKAVDVEGHYDIYKVGKDGETYGPSVCGGSFKTGTPFSLTMPAGAALGTYSVRLSSVDSKGKEVKTSGTFTLADTCSTGAGYASARYELDRDFIYADRDTFATGKPVNILYIPKEEGAKVHYIICANGDVVDEGIFSDSTAVKRVSMQYKEEYGDGVTLSVFYVKEGHHDIQSVTVTRPVRDNRLTLEWSAFRDKLSPGEAETWKLKVKDSTGKPVKAEVLATLYDASLESLASHSWNLYLWNGMSITRPSIFASTSTNGGFCSVYLPVKRYNEQSRQYRTFKVGFSGMGAYYSYGSPRFYGNRRLGKLAMTNMVASSKAMVYTMDAEESTVADMAMPIAGLGAAESTDMNKEEFAEMSKGINVRSDFAETAFFMPQLETDEDGEACIAFTIPQSLTKWRFMALAHTKDIRYGQLTADMTVEKSFALRPSFPRFFREGDKVDIKAVVENLTDGSCEGKAVLKISEANTGRTLLLKSVKYNVKAKTSESVNFSFNVPEGVEGVICEMVAKGGRFSDGEKTYVPVLSNKERIVETMPFYQEDKGQLTLSLDSILDKRHYAAGRGKKVTVEYTSDPRWNILEAVQIPDASRIMSSIDYSRSIYVYSLAHHLLSSYPQVTEVLRQSLKSNKEVGLSKNGELKYSALEATPWLNDAERELSMRDKMMFVADSANLQASLSAMESKFERLKNEDGSWSWYDGMPGNKYVSLIVCKNLLLSSEYADPERRASYIKTYDKTMAWVDAEFLKEFKKEKEHGKLTYYDTDEYLYVSSLRMDRKVSQDVAKMRSTFLDRMQKNSKNLYVEQKARLASILKAFGRDKEAAETVKSLVQYTVAKPGMGRYFDTRKAQYSYSDFRVGTQLAIMDAIRTVKPDSARSLYGSMLTWLLRQKQSQMWDNPVTSVNVASLLFDKEYVSVPASSSVPQIKLNGQKLDTGETVIGSGYVKMDITDKLKKSNNKLTIGKQSNGISWGSVYVDGWADVSEYKSSKEKDEDMSVSAKCTVVSGANQEQAVSGDDTPATMAKIGDKLRLRTTVSADKDIEFVEIIIPIPACFAPTQQTSGYRSFGYGRYGYIVYKDTEIQLFMDKFSKGTMTLDIDGYANASGDFHSGIIKAQCAYDSSMTANGASVKVTVK